MTPQRICALLDFPGNANLGADRLSDVRVIQAGDSSRLALETLAEFGPLGDVRGQHFDGNCAVKARVAAR